MARDSEASKKLQDVLDDLVNKRSKETDLSRNQIAGEIGITPSALSAYCSAEKEAGIDSLRKIADYFEVSTDFLLGRTKCPSSNIDEQGIYKMIELTPEAIKRIKIFNSSKGVKEINLLNYLIERGSLSHLCYEAYVSAINIWTDKKRLEIMESSDESVKSVFPGNYQIKQMKEEIGFREWKLLKEAERVIQDALENGIYPTLNSKYGGRNLNDPMEQIAIHDEFMKDFGTGGNTNADTQE